MLFDYFGVSYAYLYTLVAAFFKVVPLVSTPLIGVLGGLQMFFGHGKNPLLSLFFSFLYGYIDSQIYNDVYDKQIQTTNPFFIGLSVFMGYYSFDLQGIFYGPLLVCIVTIVFKLLNELEINEKGEISVKKEEKKSK